MSMPRRPPLGEAEYADLVARVRTAVSEAVPSGASVLVVSRGDPRLLEIDGIAAAHFPQDASGDYAGHHPHDSEQAIAHLEQLRQRGAQYIAIPETAGWWLEFYERFAEHLSNRTEMVSERPGTCVIYGLGRRSADGGGVAAIDAPHTSIAQMRDYLEHLIDADARLAVVDPAGTIVDPAGTAVEPVGIAAALTPMRASGVARHALHGTSEELLAELRSLAETGVEYLVVPSEANEWLAGRPEVQAGIEARCRKVADQRYLCRVFELAGMLAQ